MINRKYMVLLSLSLISILLGSLSYCNLAKGTPTTVKGYVSIPAVAFTPDTDTYQYYRDVGYIRGEGYFSADIHLPDGVTLTNMTVYLNDNTTQNGLSVFLFCHEWYIGTYGIEGIWWVIAGVGSGLTEDPGVTMLYDDTIENATVNNANCAYSVELDLPVNTTDLCLYMVILEYEYVASQGVGGFTVPIDKFSLLAPYIALVSTITLAVSISVAYVKYRKKQ